MGKKILLSTLRLKRKMEANDMGTIIVLIVLAIIIALIIRSMVKDKKGGKSLQCGGDCSKCGGHCH
ncbi:FeoB-associated Cys-rich membrane protein [Eubacterium ventriosum]|uniref:FeoB-associated Cys-rich membrane protein n=1 Tax=Eubacterium ventriosum TaxID=39496 RepID=UPI0032C01AD1